MYRMRFHRFVGFKPLILLVVLPMELQLCELGHARQCPPSTTALAGRQACCAWRCPPSALALGAGSVDFPSASCFKVQVFLLVFLAWLLPAIVLRSLEAQMMGKFTKEQALLVDLAAEASQLLQRQRAMCAWAPPALAAPSAEGIAAGPANGAGPC